MKSSLVISLALLAGATAAYGQAKPTPRPPCEYSRPLLPGPGGEAVQYTSDVMKAKALRKRDLRSDSKQMDLRDITILDVLISPKGEVVCTKTLVGLAVLSRQIEQAVSSWKFEPVQSLGSRSRILGVWSSGYAIQVAARPEPR
jgi:hypothetical protein